MFYDLKAADRKAAKYIKSNKNLRLGTLYKYMRKTKELGVFGDYLLLAHCIYLIANTNSNVTRKQIWDVLKTTELNEDEKSIKTSLLNDLVDVYKSAVGGKERQ